MVPALRSSAEYFTLHTSAYSRAHARINDKCLQDKCIVIGNVKYQLFVQTQVVSAIMFSPQKGFQRATTGSLRNYF